VVVVKTALASFGMAICYDVRFPPLFNALAKNGAEVLLNPAAFTVPTPFDPVLGDAPLRIRSARS